MKRRKVIVAFKRKRKGKTDYKKRLKLIASNKLRLVVRKSLKNIIAQLVEFHPKGDKVLISAHTNELKKNFDWKFSKRNTSAAYLTGLLLGQKAKKQNINEAILDIGLSPAIKGSIVYAVLKGAVDAGLKIPHKAEILPDEKRTRGQHLSEEIQKNFEVVKEKILKGEKLKTEKTKGEEYAKGEKSIKEKETA